MDIITIITKFRFKKLFRGDYRLNALFKDFIIGGMSLQVKIHSRYDHANANQSTDYKMLSAIFKKIKLSPDDIFVDVGCGYGRVISYLLMKRYKNRSGIFIS